MKVTLNVPKPASKTWNVRGKDAETLFKNLNKNKFWGRYRSNMSYTPKGKPDIDSITVKSKPTITMPVWKDYSKASKEAKDSWDTMYKALLKHEENHHIIFDTACKGWKKTMEVGEDLSKKDAAKAWKDFEKATQKLQDDYDSKSKHGENEGVVLMDWE